MKLHHFTTALDSDGILLATWDMKDKSMNVIDADVMADLKAIIDHVKATDAVKGCVVTSGKDGTFSGGADLTMLESIAREMAKGIKEHGEEKAMELAFEESRRLSLLYRELETAGKPFVAAINGICLGGAFELALACHARVVAKTASVGLPEVKVGLFPGAGGTQRIARMMQTGDALQMLFKGEQLKADRAKAMGLVDEVVEGDKLIDAAKDKIKAGLDPVKPWDKDKFKNPSGPVYSPAGFMTWPPANAIFRKETYNNYPGPRYLLQAVYEGLQLPMDAALKVESRYFFYVVRTPQARNMIRSLFVSKGELEKGARRPAGVPKSNIKTVGVVGAGFMGAGIAYVSANAGLQVVLLDRDVEAAEKGKAYSHDVISKAIMRGRSSTAKRDEVLGRIKATADYNDLKDCDLIVEAVFEDPKIKADVIAKTEAVIRPDCIFASNTSTLPITGLAKSSKKPDQFIGIHFFSPVDKMLLVEIIMAEKTGDKALATALDYVRAIKKTPIVVNDCRGFFANRSVGNYILEGHLMLMEGVPAPMIDNLARAAGMPVGPLSLNDEVAIDLGLKILNATKAQLGDKAVNPLQEKLLRFMVETEGRLGRKNGKGFYDYPADKSPKRLWDGLKKLPEKLQDPDKIDHQEIMNRLLVTQALEAAKTMEEGVVTDPREADVGSILGFGFAPWSGGVLSYIDTMGAKAFVALCETLAKKHGDRFKPNKLLLEMAEKGDTFYKRFAPKKAA